MRSTCILDWFKKSSQMEILRMTGQGLVLGQSLAPRYGLQLLSYTCFASIQLSRVYILMPFVACSLCCISTDAVQSAQNFPTSYYQGMCIFLVQPKKKSLSYVCVLLYVFPFLCPAILNWWLCYFIKKGISLIHLDI